MEKRYGEESYKKGDGRIMDLLVSIFNIVRCIFPWFLERDCILLACPRTVWVGVFCKIVTLAGV